MSIQVTCKECGARSILPTGVAGSGYFVCRGCGKDVSIFAELGNGLQLDGHGNVHQMLSGSAQQSPFATPTIESRLMEQIASLEQALLFQKEAFEETALSITGVRKALRGLPENERDALFKEFGYFRGIPTELPEGFFS